MVFDRPSHGRMLPIRYPIFFGGLLHDPGQWRVMSVAHKWAQMMDDVMIQPSRKPTDDRISCRVICRCREDVIHAVLKLAPACGKVCAVDGMGRLEDQRYGQSNDQMDKHECRSDQ